VDMSERGATRITLKSGRQVGVHQLADGGSGRTVVLCHPAPGSGAFDPDPEQTRERNVRLLAVDRPGYGLSDPLPDDVWSSVGQAADDLAEVLDGLDSGPVGVAGWSAGGRVALALAARRPDLVDRVVVFGTPAPHEKVPWIPDEILQGISALRGLPPEVVHTAMASQFEGMTGMDMRSHEALELVGASPADAEALDLPGASESLATMLETAFRQGVTGLASDLAGFSFQPWGFDPAQVQAKTLLMYGSSDPVAANRHATWWKNALPDARIEMSPGAGHLAILLRWKRALSHLAPGTLRSA